MIARLLLITAALALAGGSALSGEGKPDSRVAKQLDSLGLKYTTTGAGNYSLDQDLDSGRTQTVYLMSKTESYGGLEIREIWSNAGSMASKPSADQMLDLLVDNNSEKLGAWSIEASDDGSYLIFFSVKMPVSVKDQDLADMIDFVASVADEREAALFNSDDN